MKLRSIVTLLVLLACLGGVQAQPTSSGLVRWLKADEGAVANADGLVTDWAHVSPNLNDAAQHTDGLAPLLVSNAANGLPAVRFDGVDDYLEIANSTSLLPGSGDWTVIFVDQRAFAFGTTTNAFVNFGSGVGNNISVNEGIALIRPGWNGAGAAEIFRREEIVFGTCPARTSRAFWLTSTAYEFRRQPATNQCSLRHYQQWRKRFYYHERRSGAHRHRAAERQEYRSERSALPADLDERDQLDAKPAALRRRQFA